MMLGVDSVVTIVDVGGSGCKVYSRSDRGYRLTRRECWVNGKSKEELIYRVIEDERSKGSIVLGLPGPVDTGTDVYCPPLGETISLSRARKICIHITNDVSAQVGLLGRRVMSEVTGKQALVCIGTSLGLAVFEWKGSEYETMRNAKSYEVAHEILPISYHYLARTRSERDQVRACEVFSAGGFAEQWTSTHKRVNDYIIISEQDKIADAIKLLKHKEVDLDPKHWFERLHEFMNDYLSERGHGNISRIVIRGGLVDGLIEHGLADMIRQGFSVHTVDID